MCSWKKGSFKCIIRKKSVPIWTQYIYYRLYIYRFFLMGKYRWEFNLLLKRDLCQTCFLNGIKPDLYICMYVCVCVCAFISSLKLTYKLTLKNKTKNIHLSLSSHASLIIIKKMWEDINNVMHNISNLLTDKVHVLHTKLFEN